MTNSRLETEVAALASDASTMGGLTDDFESFAARCRSRVYPEEGIPAILVVEDLRLDHDWAVPPRASTDQDLLLATALDLYGRLAREREDAPGAADLATALEVLAARYFFTTPLPDLPPPSPSRVR